MPLPFPPEAAHSILPWAKLKQASTHQDDHSVVDVFVEASVAPERFLEQLWHILGQQCVIAHAVYLLPCSGGNFSFPPLVTEIVQMGLISIVDDRSGEGTAWAKASQFAMERARDIVIIREGVLVYNDWLDRLLAVAEENEAIGLVTPLTSNGGALSYPRAKSEEFDSHLSPPEELDLLARELNAGVYVEGPVELDSCILVRWGLLEASNDLGRPILQNLGDSGKPLSQLASDAGWMSVITANMITSQLDQVRHPSTIPTGNRDSVSSKPERSASQIELVNSFETQDPLASARRTLDIGRFNRLRTGPVFLMVSHRLGGGVRRHVSDLAELLLEQGARVLIGTPADKAPSTMVLRNAGEPQLPDLPVLDLRAEPADAVKTLQLLEVTHLHVHNLVGFINEAADFFRVVAEGLDAPLDVTIHDYQSFCPQIHLVGITRKYCGEPKVNSCQSCVDKLGSRFGKPIVWGWREQNRRLLESARQVFAPSEDTANRIRRQFPGVVPVMREHPHLPTRSGVKEEGLYTPPEPTPDFDRRIAVIGAIGVPKGSEVLHHAAVSLRIIDPGLEIVVVGYTDRDEALLSIGNVRVLGRYREESLIDILENLNVTAMWSPSVTPETFSYTLSAALSLNLPVVAFDFGAVPERAKNWVASYFMPLEDMWDSDSIARQLSDISHRFPSPVERADARWTPMEYTSIYEDYYGLDSEGQARRASQA